LNRATEGMSAEVVRAINELTLPVVAVDLPSGANASSGMPFDPCVRAAVTVTFAAPKLCHVFDPAASLCGEVIVADISIPAAAIEDDGVTLALTTPADVRPHFARRLAATHKGPYGHLAIIAGSAGRSGAAVLVVDAPGLNAFAGRAADINPHGRPRVITPHPGELARLIGGDAKSINAARIDAARDAARKANCIVVLKGHQTLIADPDGY